MASVFEDPERLDAGWHHKYFQNDHPLVIELGCGWGEYTLSLAARYPEKNFVGIDIKGPRIWKGATAAEAAGLHNVAFARFRIEYIKDFFPPESIDEVWIPFPDPFARKSKSGRRLTSPEFLARYRPLLKPSAILQFKTDSLPLYEWTMETYRSMPDAVEIISHTDHLHSSELLTEETGIPSKFEQLFMNQGVEIKYIKFRLR